MSALDRLLCERLGIPPAVEAGQAEQLGHGYSIVRKAPRYPAVSSTGNGMLLLMKALRAGGHEYTIKAHGYGLVRAIVDFSQGAGAPWGDDEPMALALAAAAALGVEVPE